MTEAHTSTGGVASPLSPLKQALLALDRAQARIEELENSSHEAIAIVGIGCRIPGGENGVEGYWRLLQEQKLAVSDGVATRLADSLQGRTLPPSARRAALLDRVDLFDPRHFGISPREAVGMDPQQRILLEVCWEALEDAAIDPFSLYQSLTGVYLGIASHDYAQLLSRRGDNGAIDPHFASGIASSVAAGRISYVLGLNGPCLSLDTACSSSLVAVHLACEALRRGECASALAGGVNLILSSEPSIAFAQAGMLSPQGSVRAFDAGADGFVRGEGCGVVVLKRLRDAEAAGDRIQGLILGSAVNQDGASSGLTVPNGLAQQELLHTAHRRAGIEPSQVGYVEAHGTGTTLGDPIEAEALGVVFGAGERAGKLGIGSVKTNIGHLESAAGVAGLIKVVLGLQHGVVPGQLHCEHPSEHVRWGELPLEVVTQAREWQPIAGRRIAGVSSFGFSGTNAHVVLEGWYGEVQPVESGPREEVLALSARTEAALRALVERYVEFLPQTDSGWSEICHTAAVGRAVFGERLAVVGASKVECAEKLRTWLAGASAPGVHRGTVKAGHRSAHAALESSVAEQFVQGTKIDWAQRASGRNPRRVALPGYAFQRERYWIEPTPKTVDGQPTGRALLGHRLRAAGVAGQYEAHLQATSWIGEHVVEGKAVLPGTGHLELMLEAAADVAIGSVLEDVVLQSPLIVEGERRVQTVVEEPVSGRSRVRIYAEQPEGGWERVSEGWLRSGAQVQKPERLDLDGIHARLQASSESAPAASGQQTLSRGPLGGVAQVSRLRPGLGSEPFYAAMLSRGLDFGSRFRGLEQSWAGSGEALAEIHLREAGEKGWELQPWWLDACLQVAALAVDGAAESRGDLYLPLSIDRLEVHARPEGSSWSYVAVQRIDDNTLVADLTVTNNDGQPIVRLFKIRFRKLKPKKDDVASLVASWTYRLDWQKAALPSDAQQNAIRSVTSELEERVKQLSRSESIAEYNSCFLELEHLSAAYVLEAFRHLGWPVGALTEQALRERWKVATQHRQLFHRMLEMAVEMGFVSIEGGLFRFAAPPAPMPKSAPVDLAQRFPFGSIEIDLVARCGASLAEVLTGKADGRELVFPGGRSEDMARLYRDSVPARVYNEMLAEAVARIAKARKPMRILEVGGGTAATTQYLTEALRSADTPPSDYLFTDISPLLVKRAQQSFNDTAFFRAKVFDLEREPEPQGIEGPFDIVVAANVVHATADLASTLSRLKPLLAKDGVLLLIEVIGKQRWADITVGLLAEWWSFTDHQVRPEYPALESHAWSYLLENQGFNGIVTIPPRAEQQSIFARQELIIAPVSAPAKRILIVGEGELAGKVALHLQQGSVHQESVTAEVTADELSERLVSPAPWDAVIWVAGQKQPFANLPQGAASLATERSIKSLLTTAQSMLRNAPGSPRLYVVTAQASAIEAGHPEIDLAATPLVGLATGLATEAPQLRCTRLDCSAEETDANAARIAAEVLSNADNQWVAWRSQDRYVAKLSRMQPSPLSPQLPERVRLNTGSGIEAFAWVPDEPKELQPDEVEIDIHATAINFRDVLQSLGVVNLQSPLGTDCAGVILRVGKAVTGLVPGDAVVAIAPGCFASHAIAPQALVVRKPQQLSLAQAAAQTIAYLTADYCLHHIGQVRRGERVLIHAAAGGVGLAALHLCRQAGAEPIVTAGSEEKRAFLRSLGVAYVYDSRSLEFCKEISGGVDVVLNSLAGEAINGALALLNPQGRFIELGKTDLRNPESVAQRWPGVRYLPVDLSPLFTARSPWVAERLAVLLNDIAEGALPPLPVTTFDSAQIKQAFRFMARAQHIGRVVVEKKQAQQFHGAHLITGGLRGIGLRVAEWLANNGARELVLVSRRAAEEKAGQAIAHLQAQGVSVTAMEGDIADPEVAAKAVRLAGSSLRGVWHAAGVLDNASIAHQSWDRMRTVFRPKIDGAWNLHALTRNLPLEQFVLFSSWASIGGSHGQSNHCAANAFLDGLAHFRRAHGLPALSVNWGAWGETGAAASEEVQRQLARSGIGTMPPANALEALAIALSSTESQVGVAAIKWPRYLAQRPNQSDSSFYADFLPRPDTRAEQPTQPGGASATNRAEAHSAASSSAGPEADTSLDAILALPAALREAALLKTLSEIVRRTLGLHPGEEIDPDGALSDLGMDSLLAIELRNSLSIVMHTQFPSTILFDYPTLRVLAKYLNDDVLFLNKPVAASETEVRVPVESPRKKHTLDILDLIEQMSDDQVESSFDREFQS
jgi:acyl transferase domain-containing protein